MLLNVLLCAMCCIAIVALGSLVWLFAKLHRLVDVIDAERGAKWTHD